jgi:hypothetical protein
VIALPDKFSAVSSTVARCLAAILVVLVLATACSESETIPGEVVEQLDLAGNKIADLTEPGDEEVPRLELLRASNRASLLGTDLRFVIAGAEDELVSASAVVAVYGGTVLSYKANDTAFEAASNDIRAEQIDAAMIPAGQSGDLGASANAFVDLLEEQGIQSPGRAWWPAILATMLVISLLFLLYQAYRLWRARQRRAKRRRDFVERKAVLRDWAERLAPEVEALEEPVAAAGESARQTLEEAREFSGRIVAKVDEATSPGDLDAAEMRIGRTHIKLRDLRRDLANR